MSTQTTPQDAPATGWAALFRGGRAAVTTTLAAGVALHAINVYLATTVMPSAIVDIGGEALYAWTTTVFVFASVIGSTTAAALLAARGARASYRAAAGVLLVGTIVCALAPTMPVMLVGRFAQGLGGGVLFALSYAMVRTVFAPSLWPRALALVSAMWGVATLVGPALGGALSEVGAWRASFWVLVPVAAFFALWGAARLPEAGPGDARPRIPWASVAILAGAVGVISAASASTRLSVNVAGLVVAAALIVVWLRRERTAELRLLPTATFGADPRLRLVYLVMVLMVVATTVEVFVPFFGQELRGLGPLAAGYLGAVMSAGWTAGSIAWSSAVRRRPLVIALAPISSVVGLAVLVLAGPVRTTAIDALVVLGVGLFLLGWGVGAAWPHLVTTVLEVAPAEDEGLAGASATTVQLVATALGSAVAGAVANVAGFSGGTPEGVADAARWLFAVFLVAPLVALVVAGALRRRLLRAG